MGGGGSSSWKNECRACGVVGCPASSPLIDPPAARAELETASSEPSGAVAAGALDETFPLTRPANYGNIHPLEQPPSAPLLLVEQAPNEIPTPPPILFAAASEQEQAIPARQYMGENSPTPQPQYSPDNEVPIQRVDIVRDYPPPGHRPFGGEDLHHPNDQDQPGPSNPPRQPAGEGPIVQDNILIGDPTKVTIGEGNRGGRSTRGRVTGNVILR